MRSLMVQGVSSDAGKSLIVTALCAWLRRQGVRCAPFKAQNMSNNARVVDGGEIGTAQWLQALAAGVPPDVRMNPVLLKPESDTRSQVVVNGVADLELTRMPWRGRSHVLWPYVTEALRSLSKDFDVVVIEGAGSPAETNLWADDIVNMRVADLADAPVLLVADIDRGGAFAHLYGTWALLPEKWRTRVKGFLLNKFRGNAALLDPAPGDLQALCGVPTVGIVPWLDHRLPDEEGPTPLGGASGPRVLVVGGPYSSNLDELVALQQVADIQWARSRRPLTDADLVVLPGSKHVANDLTWLRASGLADEIREAARQGTPVLGICGGLQILGDRIEDPDGVEGAATGLGLLGVDTRYLPAKHTEQVIIGSGTLPPPWSWLGDRQLTGYEIRHGRTTAHDGVQVVMDGRGFLAGNVLGVYVHGMLEDAGALHAFSGLTPQPLSATFELLADVVEERMDTEWLCQVLRDTRGQRKLEA